MEKENSKKSENDAQLEQEMQTMQRSLEQIRQALQGLRFGNVTIVVQDGVVVQIDRTEKRRLRIPRPESDG
jgi:hypothetical protein